MLIKDKMLKSNYKIDVNFFLNIFKGTMDQQQAANGGSAADFVAIDGVAALPGVVGISDVPPVTLNGASTQSAGSGTTSPTNNGLNNNEAKRAKLDTLKSPNAPSKVIHIRNIPNDVTEAEIIHLGIPFGRVTNVLVLKGKNQAFLEMEEETSGIACDSYIFPKSESEKKILAKFIG